MICDVERDYLMIAEPIEADKLRLNPSEVCDCDMESPTLAKPRGWGISKFKARSEETFEGYGFGVAGFGVAVLGVGLEGVVDAAPAFTGKLSSYR